MAAVIKMLLGHGIAGRRGKLPNEAFTAAHGPRVTTDRDQELGHPMCSSPGPAGQLVIWVDGLHIYIFACI
jgi:hypothetical protein